MPGIGGSLPATPTREAGPVVTGGDLETTPEKQTLLSAASGPTDGQMTPLSKLQATHEEIGDSVLPNPKPKSLLPTE